MTATERIFKSSVDESHSGSPSSSPRLKMARSVVPKADASLPPTTLSTTRECSVILALTFAVGDGVGTLGI